MSQLVKLPELEELLDWPQQRTLSLYMPTFESGRETRGNQIGLKNMLQRAEQKLADEGMRKPEIDSLLSPARALLDNRDFWQHQSEGLALLISEDRFEEYHLPEAPQETVHVGEGPFMRPILPLLDGGGHYYLLALSQNESRLLSGSRDRIRELEADEIPSSLAEALRFEDPERELQMHTTGAPRQPGAQPGMFHGSGDGDPDWKQILLRYFRQIDKGLNDFLRNENEETPLILAAVDYLHPIYAEANTYNSLLPDGVTGNPDEWSVQDLHEKSWTIAGEFFGRHRKNEADRFEEMGGTDLVSHDPEEIVSAAHWGRIDTLFVNCDATLRGAFDEETDRVEIDNEGGEIDLIEQASVETLQKSGRVFCFEPIEWPQLENLAAIFRYPAGESGE